MTLEEIYDDPVHPVLVHNYQVRLFAMTAEDAPTELPRHDRDR